MVSASSLRQRRTRKATGGGIPRLMLPRIKLAPRILLLATILANIMVYFVYLQGRYIAMSILTLSRRGNKDTLGICSESIPLHRSSTAITMWKYNIGKIIEWSKHPDDPEFSHREWTSAIVNELSVTSLRNAIVYRPSHDITTKILSKFKSAMKSGSKIKIAVVGGAVSEGQECDKAIVEIPMGSIMANPLYCAWPYRLEQFINSVLGAEVVQIVNMAEEGTETALMTPLLRNRIYPPDLGPTGPDIVINAYSTSDYRPADESPLQETIQTEIDAFIRSVRESAPSCNPPLIIHLVDSTLIWNDKESADDDVMIINYNAALSKVLKKVDVNRKKLDRDVPFGMAGHVALVYILGFSFMDILFQYCSGTLSETSSSTSMQSSKCIESKSATERPCIFAWFAGPAGTVNKANQIQQYIEPYILENNGWMAETDMSTGFSRKAGLEAKAQGATITFQFKSIPREIEFINLMTVKSNLPKYESSIAQFTVIIIDNNKPSPEISFQVEGSHTSPTHVTYPIEVDLKGYKAPIGADLQLKIQLLHGNSFKIIGMMLCS